MTIDLPVYETEAINVSPFGESPTGETNPETELHEGWSIQERWPIQQSDPADSKWTNIGRLKVTFQPAPFSIESSAATRTRATEAQGPPARTRFERARGRLNRVAVFRTLE